MAKDSKKSAAAETVVPLQIVKPTSVFERFKSKKPPTIGGVGELTAVTLVVNVAAGPTIEPSVARLSLQQKNAATQAYVRSATDCIARTVAAEPSSNLGDLIVESMPKCLEPVRAMIAAYVQSSQLFSVDPYHRQSNHGEHQKRHRISASHHLALEKLKIALTRRKSASGPLVAGGNALTGPPSLGSTFDKSEMMTC